MLPSNSTALTQTSCTIVFLGGYGNDNQPYACSVSRCQKETLWKRELNKLTFHVLPSPSPVCQRWNFKVLNWSIIISNVLGDFHVSALVGLQSSGFSDLLCFVLCEKRVVVENLKVCCPSCSLSVFCLVFSLYKLCSKCSIEAQKTLNLLQKEICQILQYITGFRKQLTCEPGLVNHFIHNVFSLLIQIIDAMFEVPEVHRSICNFIDIVNYFRKKVLQYPYNRQNMQPLFP